MPPKAITKKLAAKKPTTATKAAEPLADSPPPSKKAKVSPTTIKTYSIESTKPYTINQYPSLDESHDKIDLILHEGGFLVNTHSLLQRSIKMV